MKLTHKTFSGHEFSFRILTTYTNLKEPFLFLPFSHTYQFTFSFSMQLLNGPYVYYFGKPPMISALMPAFKIVKTAMVLSVQLIMEKKVIKKDSADF